MEIALHLDMIHISKTLLLKLLGKTWELVTWCLSYVEAVQSKCWRLHGCESENTVCVQRYLPIVIACRRVFI